MRRTTHPQVMGRSSAVRVCGASLIVALSLVLPAGAAPWPFVQNSQGQVPVPIVAVQNVCAWPNLTLLGDGTVAAIIFNQPAHGQIEGDMECWASTDGGQSWQYRGTPAPHDPNTNRLNFIGGLAGNGDLISVAGGYVVPQPSTGPVGVHPWLSRSSDGGVTWSIDKEAFPFTGPHGGLMVPYGDTHVAADGSLCGFAYDTRFDLNQYWSYMVRSPDDGHTWNQMIPLDNSAGLNETSGIHLGNGTWLAAVRTAGDQHVALYRSTNDGYLWSFQQNLTEGGQHPGQLLRLADGSVLFTYGNRTGSEHFVEVRASRDHGATWSSPKRVASFWGDGGYPSSVQRPDGQIVTAFYGQRSTVYNGYHMAVAVWDPESLYSVIVPPPVILPTKDSSDFDWEYEWNTAGVYPDDVDIDGRPGGDFWDVSDSAALQTLALDGYLQFSTPKSKNAQWQADDHNGYPGNVWPNRFTLAEGWTIEVAVQVIEDVDGIPAFMLVGGLPTDGGPQATMMVGETGQAWWDSLSNPRGTPLGDPVDNTDTYHVFRMVQLPGTATCKVWRDGVLVGDNLAVTSWGPYDRICFGDCSGASAGTARLDYVRFTAGAWAPPGYQPAAPGDANGDGKVDDLDASILAANWQRAGGATWAQGDFNNDGNVNDLDASILAANWLCGVGAAVPEPSTLLLLQVGAVAVAWALRQRVHSLGCGLPSGGR